MCLRPIRSLVPTCLVLIATGAVVVACESAQSAPAARPTAAGSDTPTLPNLTSSAAASSASTLPGPSTWSPRTLTIASWNLEWLSAANNHGPVPRDDAAFARLGQYAARLNADVIAVQEVESVAALARVFDPTRYAFYVTADASPQRTGFVYDKRLSVHVHPDYTALNVGSLRSGADLSVSWNGTWVRLLSVHLKSGCFTEPLTHDDACAKLRAQVPKLEAWIDARANEPTPFAVLGDFNRRLFGTSREPVWRALDDGQPPESDLFSPTEGGRAQCWRGPNPQFIDHLVLSRSLTALLAADSFTQQPYDATDAPYRKQLSDHCPISLRLNAETSPPSGSAAPATVPPQSTGPASSARSSEATARSSEATARSSEATAQGSATSAQGSAAGPPSSTAPPGGSATGLIKGNRSRKGERYYHTPECPHYKQVKVDTAKGEHYFADEASARAAGYQRSPDCPKR